jgi:uncharacterized protein (DUF2235 family)
MAEWQNDRFNIWASNIGVFAAKHSSLDYRLRTAPSAKIAVDGNLYILCTQILRGTHSFMRPVGRTLLTRFTALTGLSQLDDKVLEAFADLDEAGVSDFGLTLFESSDPVSSDRMSALKEAEDTISTLHQLSLAVRKMSNRSSLVRVPKLHDMDGGYKIVKEFDGPFPSAIEYVAPVVFEITAGFENFLSRVLTARWLRSDKNIEGNTAKELGNDVRNDTGEDEGFDKHLQEYRQVLFTRCVTAISSRRRQLTYFQTHETNLEKRKTTSKGSKKPINESNLQPEASQIPSLLNFREIAGQRLSLQDLDGLTASTVPSKYPFDLVPVAPSRTESSSIGSVSTTEELDTAGPFEVPPAPKLEPQELEKMCPYCYLVHPAKTFSVQKKSRKWKKHLLKDLQPYVCLFKNCPQSERTYRTVKEWKAHLNEPHKEDWSCKSPHPADAFASDDSFVFDTAAKYQEHVIAYHPNVQPSDVEDMSIAASRPAMLPQWCFVCLTKQDSQTELQEHIANHLEMACLLALPGREDVRESSIISSGPPSNAADASVINEPRNIDLLDPSSLYGDESSQSNIIGISQELSAGDFAERLSSIDKATSAAPNPVREWVHAVQEDSLGSETTVPLPPSSPPSPPFQPVATTPNIIRSSLPPAVAFQKINTSARPSKRLVIFCNGTWTGLETKVANAPASNMRQLANMVGEVQCTDNLVQEPAKVNYIKPHPSHQDNIIAGYQEGVGLNRTFLEYIWDSTTASAIEGECISVYKFIVENYTSDHEIWLFGFSRGAFTIRCVAGMINNCGIIKRPPKYSYQEVNLLCYEVFCTYRSKLPTDAPRSEECQRLRADTTAVWPEKQPIRFMGCIDTIGSLGIPHLNAGPGFDWSAFEFFDQHASSVVQFVYHAPALHDRLRIFPPCLIFPSVDYGERKEKTVVVQKWFPGTHYDLGRTTFRFVRQSPMNWILRAFGWLPHSLSRTIYPNEVLSDCVLRWLLEGIQEVDAGSPSPIIPDAHGQCQKLSQRIASVEPMTTGSGDICSNVLNYAPAGTIWDTIHSITRFSIMLISHILPLLGDNIQDLLGIKNIVAILSATADRRVPVLVADVYPYKDKEKAILEEKSVVFSVEELAKMDRMNGLGMERYPSRTYDSFLLWRRVFGRGG